GRIGGGRYRGREWGVRLVDNPLRCATLGAQEDGLPADGGQPLPVGSGGDPHRRPQVLSLGSELPDNADRHGPRGGVDVGGSSGVPALPRPGAVATHAIARLGMTPMITPSPHWEPSDGRASGRAAPASEGDSPPGLSPEQ